MPPQITNFFGNDRYVWVIPFIFWIYESWLNQSYYPFLIISAIITIFHQAYHDELFQWVKEKERYDRDLGLYMRKKPIMTVLYFAAFCFNTITLYYTYNLRGNSFNNFLFFCIYLVGYFYVVIGILLKLRLKRLNSIVNSLMGKIQR